MLLSDVCLSCTVGLSREQRPKNNKIGTEVAHVRLAQKPLSRSKGQGQQAALLTAMLVHQL